MACSGDGEEASVAAKCGREGRQHPEVGEVAKPRRSYARIRDLAFPGREVRSPGVLNKGRIRTDLGFSGTALDTAGAKAERGRPVRKLLLEPRLKPGSERIFKVEPIVLLTERM